MENTFLGNRIHFTSHIQQQGEAALDVAMLGHCPGSARIDKLSAQAQQQIRAAGFAERLDEGKLHHLPIPLMSFAQFDEIFPEARQKPCDYQSRLGGKQAWLPAAVEDFFANGGEHLWLIAIPENEGFQGFFPRFDGPLHDVENLRGLSVALVLSTIGLVAMPDLERLQIAANLEDIPRKRLANPTPTFVPCGVSPHSTGEDDHRERRHSDEVPRPTEPTDFHQLLQTITSRIQHHRPDVQCLLSMPLDYSAHIQSPTIDSEALNSLEVLRSGANAYQLRQVQFLYPYLRTRKQALRSSVGAIAGLIAQSAAIRGHWRSIAHVGLVSDASLFPSVSSQLCIQLRESPGIGVLTQQHGRIQLDDERLCVSALHRFDNPHVGTRSGEVVRFIGFLVRKLKTLGERLVFNLDPQDPRPHIALRKFLTNLYHLGALRGDNPESAFTIKQHSAKEGLIAFDIELAPAYPIDKITVSLINRQGQWQVSANPPMTGGEHV